MRTGIINFLTHRWPLAVAVAVSSQLLLVGPSVAEEDHLKGYKIKDLNQVAPPANPYTLTNQFGSESCELKKPQFFLVQSAKNGGDDPRGVPAGNFVCYKAKCTGPLPPTTEADSQFGAHSLATKKAQLICLPVNVCGDGNLDPGEQCDGTAGACPGSCLPDCTCPTQACGNNVREGTEDCDGADATACPNDCLPDCTCAPACPTSGNSSACTNYSLLGVCSTCCDAHLPCAQQCTIASAIDSCYNSSSNNLCSISATAAGCAAECCP